MSKLLQSNKFANWVVKRNLSSLLPLVAGAQHSLSQMQKKVSEAMPVFGSSEVTLSQDFNLRRKGKYNMLSKAFKPPKIDIISSFSRTDEQAIMPHRYLWEHVIPLQELQGKELNLRLRVNMSHFECRSMKSTNVRR